MKKGLFYQADLVTRRLSAKPLAEHLLDEPMRSDYWKQLGHTLAKFHNKGVYHADLNARNIMLGEESCFYLIDFDRGEKRIASKAWQISNINRLRRSLDKFCNKNSSFYFTDDDWNQLMNGYQMDLLT